MKTNSNKLTKKDLFRANWRWLWASQLSWNYEKMMAPGYFYTVLPFLKPPQGYYYHKKEYLCTDLMIFNNVLFVLSVIVSVQSRLITFNNSLNIIVLKLL